MLHLIYYDGTGLANPSRVSGLPKGFVVSRAYFGDDFPAALEQVRLAAQLALSDIGFADLLTPEHPLRIVAIGHPGGQDVRAPGGATAATAAGKGASAPGGSPLSLAQLSQELGLLELLAPERVVIEGFVAPR